MKKIIALLLTLIMTFSIISMPVSAAVDTDQVKTDVENVVENVGNIFDSVIDIINAVHELVGGILAIFDKECPFCGEVHGDEKLYIVSFDLNYEGSPKTIKQKVVANECATVETPTRAGYKLVGWYTDKDLTEMYGPEHVTLKANSENPYYYYIYRYAGSGTVASSGAKVTIHQGNTIVAEFNVPTDLGDGDYWNVFAIKNGQLIVRNTMTSSAETTYAN